MRQETNGSAQEEGSQMHKSLGAGKEHLTWARQDQSRTLKNTQGRVRVSNATTVIIMELIHELFIHTLYLFGCL